MTLKAKTRLQIILVLLFILFLCFAGSLSGYNDAMLIKDQNNRLQSNLFGIEFKYHMRKHASTRQKREGAVVQAYARRMNMDAEDVQAILDGTKKPTNAILRDMGITRHVEVEEVVFYTEA